jgi:hypothetical protein
MHLRDDKPQIMGKVASGHPECEELMKTLQTPSGSARNTRFSKISLPQELVEIAMLSALGWSMCLLMAVYFAPAGSSYPDTEIATLAATVEVSGFTAQNTAQLDYPR